MIRKIRDYFARYMLAACLYLLAACQHPDKGVAEALPFHDGCDSLWGLVHTDGTVRMAAGSFARQPSAVVGGMFTLPLANGQVQLYAADQPAAPVTLRTFARIGHFFDDVTPALETDKGPILIIDKQGRDIASTALYPQYDIVQMHNFSNGRALFVTAQGKCGYMDTEGNVCIPPLYDVAYDFHEGIALVGMNNSAGATGYQLIDTDGQVTGNVFLSGCLLDTRFSDGKLLFKELHNGHLGFLNRQGNAVLYLPASVRQASRCAHGVIVARTDEGTGGMDDTGQMILPAIYQDAFIAGDNRIAVCQQGHWQLVNTAGEAITTLRFDTIGAFYADGHAVARSQGTCRFINREGQETGTDFAYVAEDSTAQRLKPQVFTIRRPSTDRPAPASSTAGKDSPKKDIGQPRPAPLKGQATPSPHTRIENKDWQKVARQHPFYQEAVKVMSGKLEEQDRQNRQMILNYVEHLRTSYTTKDIDFLEQLFSENALIVVGTVVHTAPQESTSYLPPAQVVYNVKSKRQYLDRLKEVFKANRNIDVQFSDFHIMRHPTQRGIYGVSLRQKYHSDIYSDDGYLFLLWDFRDKTAPKIHVRTWQPRMQPDHTPLPENEIFSIRNFNLQ